VGQMVLPSYFNQFPY